MILFDKAIAVLRDPEASADAKDLAEQIVREWKDGGLRLVPMKPYEHKSTFDPTWDDFLNRGRKRKITPFEAFISGR